MSSATLNFKIMHDVPAKTCLSTTRIIIVRGENMMFSSQKETKQKI